MIYFVITGCVVYTEAVLGNQGCPSLKPCCPWRWSTAPQRHLKMCSYPMELGSEHETPLVCGLSAFPRERCRQWRQNLTSVHQRGEANQGSCCQQDAEVWSRSDRLVKMMACKKGWSGSIRILPLIACMPWSFSAAQGDSTGRFVKLGACTRV